MMGGASQILFGLVERNVSALEFEAGTEMYLP